MCKILISIKPQFADLILSGEKKFEFRKNLPQRDVESLVIYASAPISRVIGEVEVIDTFSCSPATLWRKTYKNAGISKGFFDKYFQGKEVANAYVLGKIKKFKKTKSLIDYNVKMAPQSYIYL